MVKRVFLMFALLIAVFYLVGYQTVQGLGEDIKWVGEKDAELVE